MNANRRIARARRPGNHQDARLAGHLGVGFGHVGGTAFLAAAHQLDFVGGVVQRIDHGKIAFTRHAERRIDIVDSQLIDQDLAAGPPDFAWAHGKGLLCAVATAVR